MRQARTGCALAVLGAAAAAGACSPPPPAVARYPHCLGPADCQPGQQCVNQLCTATIDSTSAAYIRTATGPSAPVASVDKGSLLSSMAAKTEAISASQTSVAETAKAQVQERVKDLPSLVKVSGDYEAAGDDIFYLVSSNDITMFEMTTEAGYCYVVVVVPEAGKPVYMAAFSGSTQLADDLTGQDVAVIDFCATSSTPVRITTSAAQSTVAALRVYYLAK